MLSQCLVPFITKKVISDSLVLGKHLFIQKPFKYKIFDEVIQYVLKSLEVF